MTNTDNIERIDLNKIDWRSSREFFESLGEELDKLDDKDESYNFTWVGKRKSIIEAGTPINKTLRPDIDASKDFDNTKNMLIVGDNLDALKLLQESYLDQIKMIYIDPPYNTGHDFVYHDNFTVKKSEYKDNTTDSEGNRVISEDEFTENAKSNGRFHSDWLSMMYPRLKLARNLLTNDGVIFISIDDDEIHNMRKVCDEIFGEENFINMIVVETANGVFGPKTAHINKTIVKVKDYIIAYRKSNTEKEFMPLYAESENLFDTHYNQIYENGSIIPLSIYLNNNSFASKEFKKYNLPISLDNIEKLMRESEEFKNYIYGQVSHILYQSCPYTNNIADKSIFNDGKVHEINGVLVIKTNEGKFRWLRRYDMTLRLTDSYSPKYTQSVIIGDLWKSFDKDMKNVNDEGDIVFPNGKKPKRLIKQLAKFYNSPNATILDFFAGSGTTGHAVMDLNAEDGGNRKYILVQLDEPTDDKSEAKKAGYDTIDQITAERLRRAGDKIIKEHPDLEGKLDTGFRVFRIDSENENTDIRKPLKDVSQTDLFNSIDNIKKDRSPLDLLFGVVYASALPFDLKLETKKIGDNTVYLYGYLDEDSGLVACFDDNISEDVIKEIAKLKPLTAAFKDSSFQDSAAKINLSEQFRVIAPDTKVKVI